MTYFWCRGHIFWGVILVFKKRRVFDLHISKAGVPRECVRILTTAATSPLTEASISIYRWFPAKKKSSKSTLFPVVKVNSKMDWHRGMGFCCRQCSKLSPVTHGQDWVIAGKLVLIGQKLPPAHACPQSPGFGLSTVGQAAFLHQLWLLRRRSSNIRALGKCCGWINRQYY